MTIDDAGLVGIGTTSPSYNLHVKSASGSHAEVRIETPDQTSGSVPALSFNNGDRIYSLGVMTDESFSIRDGSDSWATRLSIDTSGNVGIGTTSPNMKLNISHGDQDGLRFSCADGLESFIDFGDASDNDIGRISYDHADNTMTLRANNNSRVQISSSGTKFSENFGGTDDYIHINPGNGHNRTMEITGDAINVTTTGGSSNTLKLQEGGGNIQIPATSEFYLDGGGNTYITESAADIMDFYAGNQLFLRLDETNNVVHIPRDADQAVFKMGVGGDLQIYVDTDDAVIRNITSDKDIIFSINDGGSQTEIMRLDGSAGSVNVAGQLKINTTHDGSMYFERDGGSDFSIEHDTSQIYWYNRTISEAVFMMKHAGPVVINEGGDDAVDFRVEGDSDANLLFTDASEDRVGIGTSSPSSKLHVDGSAIFDTDTGNQPFYITRIGTLGQALKMYVDDNNAVFESIQDETSGFVGNFKFVMDSGSTAYTGFLHGTAEKMRIQSDGNVGIGTTAPTQDLHLHRSGSGDDVYIQFTNGDTGTTSGDGFQIGLAGNEDARIKQIENAPMEFWTNNTERMSISAAGDVKITESLGIGVNASSTTGRLDCSNDVVAYSTSDKRLKENIKPLDNALDKINKISGVEFDWKVLTEKDKETIHGNEGHDVGVIAQEIEEVLPEVVTTRDNGYKAVKYEKIVPLLIEAIKEQQEEIDLLKANYDQLKYNRR
tara:strand:+ start:6 stop:2156 length:2151 start_codon:yes stop_codon:yes gene_type:complete